MPEQSGIHSPVLNLDSHLHEDSAFDFGFKTVYRARSLYSLKFAELTEKTLKPLVFVLVFLCGLAFSARDIAFGPWG